MDGVDKVKTQDQGTQTRWDSDTEKDVEWKYKEFLELVVQKSSEYYAHIETKEIVSSRGKTYKLTFFSYDNPITGLFAANGFTLDNITLAIKQPKLGKWEWYQYNRLIDNNIGKKIRIYCEKESKKLWDCYTSAEDREIDGHFHIEALEGGKREEWETYIEIKPYDYRN